MDPVAYDLTQVGWLTNETQSGRFLAGIFGWDPRPSIEQVLAYFGYLLPILWLFLRGAPSPAPERTPPASAASVAA
jgi:high-affinity iron transporter